MAHDLSIEQNDERRRALELECEQARYEVKLAARRYETVDPENRLVAAELEARWNTAMHRLRGSASFSVKRWRLFLPQRCNSSSSRSGSVAEAKVLPAALLRVIPLDPEALGSLDKLVWLRPRWLFADRY